MTRTLSEDTGIRSDARLDDRAGLRVSAMPAPVRSQLLGNLRGAILSGKLQPGQHLGERELIELTGVARGTIREALRQLSAEGLVTTVPNLGSVVTVLNLTQLQQIYEVRSALEGLAGRLFVWHANPSQHRALTTALRAIEKRAAAGESTVDEQLSFQDVLYLGTDNPPLHALAETMRARIQYLWSLSLAVPHHARRSVTSVKAIVKAVASNDPDAAADACARRMATESAAVEVALALRTTPTELA